MRILFRHIFIDTIYLLSNINLGYIIIKKTSVLFKNT